MQEAYQINGYASLTRFELLDYTSCEIFSDMCETCIDADDAADQINNLKAKYDSEDVATWSEDDQLRYKVWHTLVSLADAHQALAKHQHDVFAQQCITFAL